MDIDRFSNEINELGAAQMGYEMSVINLIASDNATPRQAKAPFYQGTMIQEGLLWRRPFAGAALHDKIEAVAAQIACEVFDAKHANVQPHSCSQANQSVFHALLEPGDPVLALNFRAGGHLTHGLKANFSGRFFRFSHYGVDERTGLIDYDAAAEMAREERPKLIICGSSSYPRLFDAVRLRAIADSVDAYLMFDLSHEAGLIAAGAIPNPVPFADVATMSMDKTLRGPHGGVVLCKTHLAERIDKGVHPGTQSSFPISKLTKTAHALLETQTPEFKDYAKRVLTNAKALEASFHSTRNHLVSGGTDKHLLVLDVQTAFGLDGTTAEQRLEQISILSSRQTLLTDKSSRSSAGGGLRFGTAWATSRGYDEADFHMVGDIIKEALSCRFTDEEARKLRTRVKDLIGRPRVRDVWRVASRAS